MAPRMGPMVEILEMEPERAGWMLSQHFWPPRLHWLEPPPFRAGDATAKRARVRVGVMKTLESMIVRRGVRNKACEKGCARLFELRKVRLGRRPSEMQC